MRPEPEWTFDTYGEGAGEEIVSLMQIDIKSRGSKSVFNMDLWNWKYRNNNAGFYKKWIALARSIDGHKLVGHYTMIPVRINLNGAEEMGAQSVDTLVHPDHRKRGIFTKLAERCYEAVASENVGIVYGYPNEQSYHGFVNKLGWKDIFTIDEMAYVLDPEKVSRAKFSNVIMQKIGKTVLSMREGILDIKRGTVNEGNYISKDHRKFDFSLDMINDWLKKRYRYFILRDPSYMRWRYLENPVDKDLIIRSFMKGNELKGMYTVKLKKYPHRDNLLIGHIMEIVSEPTDKNIIEIMLHDIAKICKSKRADILHLYTTRSQHDYETINSFGFRKFDTKQYIIKALRKPGDFPGITDPANWFISLGDSDRA